MPCAAAMQGLRRQWTLLSKRAKAWSICGGLSLQIKKKWSTDNHRILCSTKVDRVSDDSILAVITTPSISSPLPLLCVVMKQISKLGAASYPAPKARWGHRWSGVLCCLVLLLQIVTNILDKLLKISDHNNAVEHFFSSPYPFRKSTFQVLLNTCSGAQNGWVPFWFSSIMDVEFHSDSQLHPSLFAGPCYQHRAFKHHHLIFLISAVI